jgi:hypothetical protein
MSHRKPSHGKMPTKPISFDETGNIDIVPPAGMQTAHLSGSFIENKADARFFPLIMSGFGPSEVRRLRTRKLRSKPILDGYLYEKNRKAQTPPPCPKLGAPTILTVYPGSQNL